MRRKDPSVEGTGDCDLSWFFLLLRHAFHGMACSVWVFMRIDIGADALSWQGLAAVPVLFIYSGYDFGYGPCPEALFVYLPLYVGMVILHRIRLWVQRAKGLRVHSCDEGRPWLAETLFFFLRPSEGVAKGFLEPVIAFSVGWLLAESGAVAMGYYVAWAGLCMVLREASARSIRAYRLKVWGDREIETQAFEEHIRRKYRR